MRDMKFLVQSSPFKPWLILCGISPTYCTEMMLLSGGQVGISRAKVIKLDVQKRESLYFQSLHLSLQVEAGERHQGWGSTKDPQSRRDGERAMERVVPQKFVKLQGLNALQTTPMSKCCSQYTGISFSWCKSWRGQKCAGFSSHSEWQSGSQSWAGLSTSLLPPSEGSGTWKVLPNTEWRPVGKTTGNTLTFF